MFELSSKTCNHLLCIEPEVSLSVSELSSKICNHLLCIEPEAVFQVSSKTCHHLFCIDQDVSVSSKTFNHLLYIEPQVSLSVSELSSKICNHLLCIDPEVSLSVFEVNSKICNHLLCIDPEVSLSVFEVNSKTCNHLLCIESEVFVTFFQNLHLVLRQLDVKGLSEKKPQLPKKILRSENISLGGSSPPVNCNSMPLVRLGLSICIVKCSYFLVRHRVYKIMLLFCLGGSCQSLKVREVKCIPGDPATMCPVLFKGSRSLLSLA